MAYPCVTCGGPYHGFDKPCPPPPLIKPMTPAERVEEIVHLYVTDGRAEFTTDQFRSLVAGLLAARQGR